VPHPTSSSNLELNCFVHGDDPRNVFPVRIARTDTVGMLKKAIKEEKKVALEHVDADVLKVWKVDVAVDDGFTENARQVELRDEKALSPVDPLSDHFTDRPAQKHVHIIARSPAAGKCISQGA
jgi:hypothetical protein